MMGLDTITFPVMGFKLEPPYQTDAGTQVFLTKNPRILEGK